MRFHFWKKHAIEIAVVVVVLMMVGSMSVPVFLERQVADVERMIHADISMGIDALKFYDSLEKFEGKHEQIQNYLWMKGVGQAHPFSTNPLRQYPINIVGNTYEVRKPKMVEGHMVGYLFFSDFKPMVRFETIERNRFPSQGEFFDKANRAYPINFRYEILRDFTYKGKTYNWFPVLSLFVFWPGTEGKPDNTMMLLPNEATARTLERLEPIRFDSDGRINRTDFFFNPTNGLKSYGYVYYDSLGNASYQPGPQ